MLNKIFLRVDGGNENKKGFDFKMFLVGLMVGLLIMLPMIVVFAWLYFKII